MAGAEGEMGHADNDDGEAGPMLAADNKESLERMASLLKGTAPDALIASPGGSPKASDVPADWQTFAQVSALVPPRCSCMCLHVYVSSVHALTWWQHYQASGIVASDTLLHILTARVPACYHTSLLCPIKV